MWASADHLCIVWCRQLMIKLNQIFFDFVDKHNFIIDSPDRRQEIIDFHLSKRYFLSFPNFELPNQTFYQNNTEWIEHSARLVRLNINKVI